MEEIVTIEQAERVIIALAVISPAAGLLVGLLVGVMRKAVVRGAAIGLGFGLLGPLVWGLWRMYGGILGIYGLDSVRGLAINLGLFVVIGLIVGVIAGLIWRRLGGGVGEERDSVKEQG